MNTISEETWLEWIDRLSDQHYVLIDQVIPDRTFAEIKTYYQSLLTQEEFAKAGIGTLQDFQIDKNIRGDWVYWLDRERDKPLTGFFSLIDEWIARLNRYCYLSISDSEFHLAYYPPGTFYKRHLDQFREQNNRLISLVFYLNEKWQPGDGGELKIYQDDREILVEPLGNRLVLFKSDLVEHEVMMTYQGRESLTGWLLYQPAGLGFLAR
ncbi:MAG: 2OG-Fe(II) oxygenase [Microscillaceae bacterium]|nr:2OG-Fe(II) oxygenase [Microscillaceae bacterium]